MPRPPPIDLDTPRSPAELSDIRAAVHAFAVAGGFSEAAAGEVIVAIGEACSNAIEHGGVDAGGGRLRLQCAWEDDAMVITLTDYCRVADVDAVRGRDLDDVRPGGLGVHCMQRLMDGFALEPDDHGWATLRLTRTRRRGQDEEDEG